MRTRIQSYFIAALFGSALAAGCSDTQVGPEPLTPPQPGHAFLTIVGDRNVFLAGGAHQTITVKYHDDRNTPLAGAVKFRVDGDGKGAALSQAQGVTNNLGEVSIDVIGGSQAAFRVVAEAQYATAVDWAVAVSNGVAPAALHLDGLYTLQSQFDMVSGLPGTVGDVIHTVIDMTDGPNDPATWLLDMIVAKADPTVADVINKVRLNGALDGFLNGLLKQYAPDIVTKLLDLGNAFGDVTKKFGLKSELLVTTVNGQMVAKHTVTGVQFNINGHIYQYSLAEMNMSPVVADGVALTMVNANQVTIGDHALPVSYGKAVVFAIDNLVIPLIDPMAGNLQELLTDLIDCYAIGGDIYNYLQFGNRGIYEGLCHTAIDFAATYAEGKISTLGGTASSFQIHGEARPYDLNNDGIADQLVGGLWEGILNLGPEASTLAKPTQKFVGNRN